MNNGGSSEERYKLTGVHRAENTDDEKTDKELMELFVFGEDKKPGSEPMFKRQAKDIVIAVTLFVLTVLGVSALFWDSMSAGYTLTFIAFMIAVSVYLISKKSIFSPFSIVCAVLSVACSISFAVTSNQSVRLISLLITSVSSVVWYSHLAGNKYEVKDFGAMEYAALPMMHSVSDMPRAVSSLFSKNESNSKTVKRVIIGAACALPLLLITIPILMHSDDAFYYLVSGANNSIKDVVAKTLTALLFIPFVLGFVFSIKHKKYEKEKSVGLKTINPVTVSAFLCVSSLVYIVYLFSQLAYFTSGFMNILPEGYKFTYAQFARQGFFELCALAAINLTVLIMTVVLTRKEEEKLPLSVKIPATFIALFTILIISTSISKMVMYIREYGMTLLRVCTSAFMIWMAVMFIAVIFRIYMKKLDMTAVGLIASLVVISVLGIFNVNSFVARYNYEAYTGSGVTIDVDYMSKLGDEGVKYLYELTHDKNQTVASEAKKALDAKTNYYYETPSKAEGGKEDKETERKYSGIGQFSFAREEAYTYMEKFMKEIK